MSHRHAPQPNTPIQAREFRRSTLTPQEVADRRRARWEATPDETWFSTSAPLPAGVRRGPYARPTADVLAAVEAGLRRRAAAEAANTDDRSVGAGRGRRQEVTEPTRYQTEPVELPLPSPAQADPAPVEGCLGCAELANVRARARVVGDMTTVSDCNVYMRRHPEGHQ